MEDLKTQLFEAAKENDIASLHHILGDDPHILERGLVNSFNETPLHVAAKRGHVDFVNEILMWQPQLADKPNSQQSYPLHLAAAKGHAEVVKALLAVSDKARLAYDSDNLLPLHLAAVNGHIEAMEALYGAKNGAAITLPAEKDGNILHWCVKGYQLEALKAVVDYVIKRDDFADCINFKDLKGNSVLHLAVEQRQVQAVKFLMSVDALEADAQNYEGLTAMDVLICSTRDVRDDKIADFLKHSVEAANKKSNWDFLMDQHDGWLEKEKQVLILVGPLIAAMAFQVGVNPPDGLWRKHNIPNAAGSSVTLEYSTRFSIWNTLALISSLTIIFLLTTGLPISRRSFMRTLRVISWFSIVCIAASYFAIMQYLREIEGGHGPFEKGDLQFSLMIVWLCVMLIILLVRVTPAKWRNGLINLRRTRTLKPEMHTNLCYESGDAAA